MKFSLLIETIHSIPASQVTLIMVMAGATAIIMNHMLDVSVPRTIIFGAALYFAGILSFAAFDLAGVVLAPDRAANTIISAAVGFIVAASLSFGLLHIWNHANDRR
jgi:drug/metabolite transporter (DMT)-like permease